MVNRILMILAGLLLVLSCATLSKHWERAEDKQSGTRFIPIELWSGEKWNGKTDLETLPANFRFGKRNHKIIKGPRRWHHPVTGQDLNVYERINETKKGTKRQLFTLNPDGTGLAKVFDSRPQRKTFYQSDNAVLFPLGLWRKGEQREYIFDEYMDGQKSWRKATIRMRRLSFTYKGVKHAMKYDWILKDAKGKIIYHERFIYAPQKSLMYYKDRLKKKK